MSRDLFPLTAQALIDLTLPCLRVQSRTLSPGFHLSIYLFTYYVTGLCWKPYGADSGPGPCPPVEFLDDLVPPKNLKVNMSQKESVTFLSTHLLLLLAYILPPTLCLSPGY